jgi:hypothetical protein
MASSDLSAGELPFDPLPLPGDRECLLCYVYRMLESGCDGTLRWALWWRDVRAPRLRGLVGALQARGGFCDCEIFFNGWEPAKAVDPTSGLALYPEDLSGCSGVRSGSGQPCPIWVPIRSGFR